MKNPAAQIFIWIAALAVTIRVTWEVVEHDVSTAATVTIACSVLLAMKLGAENLVRIVTAAREDGAHR